MWDRRMNFKGSLRDIDFIKELKLQAAVTGPRNDIPQP